MSADLRPTKHGSIPGSTRLPSGSRSPPKSPVLGASEYPASAVYGVGQFSATEPPLCNQLTLRSRTITDRYRGSPTTLSTSQRRRNTGYRLSPAEILADFLVRFADVNTQATLTQQAEDEIVLFANRRAARPRPAKSGDPEWRWYTSRPLERWTIGPISGAMDFTARRSNV